MIDWKALFKKGSKKFGEFVKPESGPDVPLFSLSSAEICERNKVSDLFTFRYFDKENNLCYLDDGDVPAVGFFLAISPLLVAGVDTEPQIEAVINAFPPDSVLQFGKLCTPQVDTFIDRWSQARLVKNSNKLLRFLTEKRTEFMKFTAAGPSMLPNTRLHSRMHSWYISARIPFKGDPSDSLEYRNFIKQVCDIRSSVSGALSAAMISSEVLDEESVKFFMRELLNPHLDPNDRILENTPGTPLSKDIVCRNTRMRLMSDGRIGFSSEVGPPDIVVTPITIDTAPEQLYLPMMGKTLGDPVKWDERITCPYWAYTTIHILHPENAKDALFRTLGMLNKQTMSESPWFRAMMGHLFERKDHTEALMKETGKGHTLVRAYSGINIYTPLEEAKAQTELVKGLYRNMSFRASEENFISLPVFVASFPMQYSPASDPPNKGLQRAWLMSSLNAACMVHIQGDWQGTGPSNGGLLLVSRSGQLATFDLLQTSINYNFIVVATSGAGKSFLTNEIVNDFLSKGGIARLIDVGRSYARFCELMGGENIIFQPDAPMSLNPFSDVITDQDLSELMPMLKDLIRLMAYPNQSEDQTPAYEYQLIEKAISESWAKHGRDCELANVHEWLTAFSKQNSSSLMAPEHSAANRIALQLEPFSHGRYRKWFTGKRTVKFTKALVVVELEELKQDPALQAVVLQLMMFQITKEMYLSERSIPKLFAVDEAWDLLGGVGTGRFIETAFKRMRKYNGIAGVITQSFEDFEKSAAAKAAIENAAWQFILYQRPDSITHAIDKKRITADANTIELIRSVKSGPGFSEVFIRGENASGLYRFVTDRHSYYMFTSKASDINKMNDLMSKGMSLEEAIDYLSMQDYKKMWPDFIE